MERLKIESVETADQAVQIAIDWQQNTSQNSMYYSEAADWQDYFTQLAEKFDLTDEFSENGII